MKKLLLLISLSVLIMCNTNKTLPQMIKANAPLIIYKTKADYANNIPIILDDKKNIVVSYPALKDVFFNGELARPTKLKNGYFLDNFGISTNSVFTSFSFEEYSKLEKVPSIDELKNKIIEKNPFIEIWNCGNRNDYKTIDEVNDIIKSNFKGCSRIK